MAPIFFFHVIFMSQLLAMVKKIQTNPTDFQLLFYTIPQKMKFGNFTIPCSDQIETGFLSISSE